jgi:hypothetical protein
MSLYDQTYGLPAGRGAAGNVTSHNSTAWYGNRHTVTLQSDDEVQRYYDFTVDEDGKTCWCLKQQYKHYDLPPTIAVTQGEGSG